MKTIKRCSTLLTGLAVSVLAISCAEQESPVSPDQPMFSVGADEGAEGVIEDAVGRTGSPIGTPVPMAEAFRTTVEGDYVAAGVGFRNTGSGNITINLPSAGDDDDDDGPNIVNAFLYWAMIRNTVSPALASGNLNGNPITGSLIAHFGRANSGGNSGRSFL